VKRKLPDNTKYRNDELEQLNKTFRWLLDDVNEWSKATLQEHVCEVQSIFYGILREVPELWCNVYYNAVWPAR